MYSDYCPNCDGHIDVELEKDSNGDLRWGYDCLHCGEQGWLDTCEFTLFHADHGITPEQMAYIKLVISRECKEGFFLRQVEIPWRLGAVPCALYGPAMGDLPVPSCVKNMKKRSEDRPADPMVDLPMRLVTYVQVIGTCEGMKFNVFTIYGGPLAPQNPEDPTCADVEASKQFWAEHALSSR